MQFSKVQLLKTADGSFTLLQQDFMQTYHSVNGALQEAKHVFLETGLIHYQLLNDLNEVNILEVGFGTGLNFLVTADYCENKKIRLNYTGIEAFPVAPDVMEQIAFEPFITNKLIWKHFLNQYPELLKEQAVRLSDFIQLQMEQKPVLATQLQPKFDLIYYDAFAPVTQPEMWSQETIGHITSFLKTGGLFVTYSITGNLKRILKSLGFTIEKPKGAAGKREMLRAKKI